MQEKYTIQGSKPKLLNRIITITGKRKELYCCYTHQCAPMERFNVTAQVR